MGVLRYRRSHPFTNAQLAKKKRSVIVTNAKSSITLTPREQALPCGRRAPAIEPAFLRMSATNAFSYQRARSNPGATRGGNLPPGCGQARRAAARAADRGWPGPPVVQLDARGRKMDTQKSQDRGSYEPPPGSAWLRGPPSRQLPVRLRRGSAPIPYTALQFR